MSYSGGGYHGSYPVSGYYHHSLHHAQEKSKLSQKCWKTKFCKFFMEGRCNRENCTYAHSCEEMRVMPNLRKTKLCGQWLRGKCNDPLCKFAHGEWELNPNPLSGPPAGPEQQPNDQQQQQQQQHHSIPPAPSRPPPPPPRIVTAADYQHQQQQQQQQEGMEASHAQYQAGWRQRLGGGMDDLGRHQQPPHYHMMERDWEQTHIKRARGGDVTPMGLSSVMERGGVHHAIGMGGGDVGVGVDVGVGKGMGVVGSPHPREVSYYAELQDAWQDAGRPYAAYGEQDKGVQCE
ncbi:unnamed protein product [Vitrella brassicaformis CCMP3155]|uniref:C3H1-type domain-containing protein n=1 Tax=Vitrella brassicaformis (strain CCMP3155) TaxID=1169540 RepID=A0A0G4FTX9_VITBC|nr:unnamed protein product [Vitrella brassicaformis CCMP3155]|eukprot:CEM18360.1 unnamed protein product [Vitrella brassicaformis CCMP3155]